MRRIVFSEDASLKPKGAVAEPPKEVPRKPPSRAESREEPEPLLANGLTTLRETNELEEW